MPAHAVPRIQQRAQGLIGIRVKVRVKVRVRVTVKVRVGLEVRATVGALHNRRYRWYAGSAFN